mgnify:FL=1
MKKIILTYIFCSFVSLVVGYKIYDLYQLYVEEQTAVMASVKSKAQKIASGELVIDKKEQARLLIAIADREPEFYITKFYAFLSIVLATVAIFSYPVVQQLTRASTRKN